MKTSLSLLFFLYNIIIEFQFLNVISDGEEPVIHLNRPPYFFSAYLEVYILMMELFFLRIKRFATP